MTPAGDLSRRRLLRDTAGAGAVALTSVAVTSCDDDTSGRSDPPAGAPEPEPDPDRRIRSELAAGSEDLILRYAETARRHRKLRTGLAAYEKRHRQHLEAVRELADDQPPTPTRTPTPTGKARPPRVDVPRPAAKAVRALVEAEQSTMTERAELVSDVADPELARLLASIVACGRTHVLELPGLED